MPPTPRKNIDPSFIAELDCPICGQDALSVKSLANYPDFVTCGSCDSQFAVEQDGDRIMYGKIPATYPRTRRFALQQWAWPEAIARRASDERPDSPAAPASPTIQAPPPVSPSIEEPEEAEAAAPEEPATADLEPQETDQEPSPIEPASPSLEESSPAAEAPTASMPAADIDSEEPWLDAPADEADDLPAPAVSEPTTTADEPSLTGPDTFEAPDTSEAEEDFLTELPDEREEATSDFSFEAADIQDRLPATDQVEEEDGADDFDGPPAASDRFSDASQDPTPLTPESEPPDEGVLEKEVEQEGAEPALPSDWTSEPEQPESSPSTDEEEFLAEMERAELEAGLATFDDDGLDESADWDEADVDFDGLFTPPFGDDEPEETDEMAEDLEPAPPMPNWLNQAEEIPEGEGGDDDDFDGIDFTGLRDEVEEEPAATDFGQEEDLLASLWGDEEDEVFDGTGSGEPETELDDDLAGFAGLGALSEEGQAEGFEEELPDQADDLWEQEPLAEQATDPPEMQEAAPDLALTEEEQREQIARSQWAGNQTEEEAEVEPLPALAEEAEGGEPVSFDADEPPPGERYRVVLQKPEAAFPEELCAHCSQSPTAAKLPIAASVYRGTGAGERQTVSYRVPVCADCRDRAKAQSDERQTAQLQAHLISVLVALILVVSALAFRIVDFQERIGVDLAILFLLAGMGYAIPVAFLLIRASRIGKPADAKYVETTLRVPSDTEGAETAFEFRSQRYAHYFHQKNEEEAVSGVNKVRERQYEGELT